MRWTCPRVVHIPPEIQVDLNVWLDSSSVLTVIFPPLVHSRGWCASECDALHRLPKKLAKLPFLGLLGLPADARELLNCGCWDKMIFECWTLFRPLNNSQQQLQEVEISSLKLLVHTYKHTHTHTHTLTFTLASWSITPKIIPLVLDRKNVIWFTTFPRFSTLFFATEKSHTTESTILPFQFLVTVIFCQFRKDTSRTEANHPTKKNALFRKFFLPPTRPPVKDATTALLWLMMNMMQRKTVAVTGCRNRNRNASARYELCLETGRLSKKLLLQSPSTSATSEEIKKLHIHNFLKAAQQLSGVAGFILFYFPHCCCWCY